MHLLVIVVYRLHPHSGGWKKEKNDALCNSKGDQFIKCIENNSYYNYGHDMTLIRVTLCQQNIFILTGS